MKRCPQCEFIYEDDQSLCDMDGVLLVFDTRTLPNLHALAPVEVALAPRAYWRHRTFPAMAALILATVLSLVYFVSTQRQTRLPAAPLNGVSTTAPVVTPITTQTPLDANPPSPPADVSETSEAKTQANKPSNTTRKLVTKPPTTETKRTAETKKEDSKVESILKKTGRILKKPFKF